MYNPDPPCDAQIKFFEDALAQAKPGDDAFSHSAGLGDYSGIGHLVRLMAIYMVAVNASDLHVEPIWQDDGLHTLVRIRDFSTPEKLRELTLLPFTYLAPIAHEWKRLANTEDENRARPFEGEARLAIGESRAAFRVTTAPMIDGEKLAIRLIPTRIPSLDALGYGTSPMAEWIRQRRGIVLFSGPTGSGKTTTMAACVHELAQTGQNILAYDAGYLFPKGVTLLDHTRLSQVDAVNAMMAQDADVMVIGELAHEPYLSPNLCERIVWAADTGHLVLASIHARSALSALYNFEEAGTRRRLLSSVIVGIVGQHLVRSLCQHCKIAAKPDARTLEDATLRARMGGYDLAPETMFHGAVGCDACSGKGYFRRAAVHEFFEFRDDLKTKFAEGATPEQLAIAARGTGQISAFAAGVKLAAEVGTTSLDEVIHVLSE